jgi:hypothetical protein
LTGEAENERVRPKGTSGAHPAVTIVIPTFNRADLLPNALESALAQTYPNFDLVVSDNASTDETARVVAQFDDPRLRYVRRSTNLELNDHYNVFMAEVESPYMFVLPDDDMMEPDALELLVPVLQAFPEAGIVHGRVRIVDGDGDVISAAHDMSGFRTTAIESGHDYIRAAVAASHRIHATTALYRTKAIQAVPLDQRDYPATEFGVWLRLALDWDIAFLATRVATIRIHDRSYTASNASVTTGGYIQGAGTIQSLYDVKLRFLREHGDRLADAARLRKVARTSFASQLVNYAGHVTLPERRLGPTVRTLFTFTKREPRVATSAGAWRLVVGSVLGPRLVDAIKRRTRERQKHASAVTGR